MKQMNGTMLQYFEWYLNVPEGLWNKIKEDAEEIADLGITSCWLPPAYKGIQGRNEVGYGVYDMYDLGEFDQKGSIPTKYGTKDEYLRAIESLKRNGINAYADVVLNHKMGADLDFSNREVIEECKRWGLWYQEFTRVDGFRLDAVKHIDSGFYKEWVQYLRAKTQKELFTVGEYWSYDVNKLNKYLADVDYVMSLFDVPLHANFYDASIDTNYDMSQILANTLITSNPMKAVTFVDNHDTQPNQALQSFIEPWFKQFAYSVILLRKEGYPCVFYGDLYGMPYANIPPVERIKTLLKLRKIKAYGRQHDYFDHKNVVGWTREGDNMHLNSGLAVLMSNSFDAEKRMYVGTSFAGEKFIDCLDNCADVITIDDSGCGVFKTKGRSCSVWVKI